MQADPSQILLLRSNKVMEYEWGSSSEECLIHDLTREEHKRYAQLWMGTHKNGPSMLDNHHSLSQYLKENHFPDLTFLFKILCIEKSLSIQLHPNKVQAERLFLQKPGIYPDDNEKPEMFFTLTDFQCFFGIIDQPALQSLLKKQPFSLLKSRKGESVKAMIAEICSFSKEELRGMIDTLIERVDDLLPQRKAILKKMQNEFPYDAGILVSCLLRYKNLPPGECYAIAAGVPHAYLSGTCLEVMKSSDNVVRLGLTPKLKDIPTLLEIMNETIGLDGIKVERSQQGYCWNGLVINDVENLSDEQEQLNVPFASIGIVAQKSLHSKKPSITAQKGSVLFFPPGKYLLLGPFKLYLGSSTPS